jgi:hypothetical protein
MADDKYKQDIHIIRKGEGSKDDVADESLHKSKEESTVIDAQQVEEYDSTYEQILAKLLETGLVSDDDLSLIASIVESGNVVPFALKDRLARSKKNNETRSKQQAKNIGHFSDNIRDLTVGKESGKYTESKDNSGPVSTKEMEADKQKEPENKPGSAPFKGPDMPVPPVTPTPKR